MWKIPLVGPIFTSYAIEILDPILREVPLSYLEVPISIFFVRILLVASNRNQYWTNLYTRKIQSRSHEKSLSIHTRKGKAWRTRCQKRLAKLSISVCLSVYLYFSPFLSVLLCVLLPPSFSLALFLSLSCFSMCISTILFQQHIGFPFLENIGTNPSKLFFLQ